MAADISDPFGVFAGQFTQIPLNSNAPLIPYGDLQASGSYGRGLVLPDDIIPTLGLQTLTGSKNGAKLWTGAHVDGAADVYVVNQGGGGAIVSTLPAGWTATESGGDAGLHNIAGSAAFGGSFGYSTSDPMRHLTLEVWPDMGGTPPGLWCEWDVGLSNNGANPNISLFKGNFYKTMWGSASPPVARYQLDVGIIDWVSWGLVPGTACFYLFSNDGSCVLAESYILGH